MLAAPTLSSVALSRMPRRDVSPLSNTTTVSSTAAPSTALTLSDFTVVGEIARGTFGTVSRIVRNTDGAVFVWKAINYAHLTSAEKSAVVTEVNVLRVLHHRNVVRYVDRIIDRSSKRLFIVMEHCAGGDLAERIKNAKQRGQSFSADVIHGAAAAVSAALAHCHSQRLLHRDLKPANILLSHADGDLSASTLKLADFGLSRVLSSSASHAQTHVGTPYYLAPEQIRGDGVGCASDVWALGCVLYELATLNPPFRAANALSLARLIERGQYDRRPLRLYDHALDTLIAGCLTVDVSRRWTIQDVLRFPPVAAALSYQNKLADLQFREAQCERRERDLSEWATRLEQRERLLDSESRSTASSASTESPVSHRTTPPQRTSPSSQPHFSSSPSVKLSRGRTQYTETYPPQQEKENRNANAQTLYKQNVMNLHNTKLSRMER